MIDKIEHYSMNNPASVYDEDSLTALQLAGRTAAKVNQCIEEVNQIDKKVADETDKHIKDGTFDNQIEQYTQEVRAEIEETENQNVLRVTQATNNMVSTTAQLETRLDNLLGKVTTGSTTMDSEIIDARVGSSGKTYGSTGEAIRKETGVNGGNLCVRMYNASLNIDTTAKTITLDRVKQGDMTILYGEKRFAIFSATTGLPVTFDYTGLGDGTYAVILNVDTKVIRLLYQAGSTSDVHFYKSNEMILAVIHMSDAKITRFVYAPSFVTQNGTNPYDNYYNVSQVMGVSDNLKIYIDTVNKTITHAEGFIVFDSNKFVYATSEIVGSYAEYYTENLSNTLRVYYDQNNNICVGGLQCVNPTDRVIAMLWFDRGTLGKVFAHDDIINNLYVDGEKYVVKTDVNTTGKTTAKIFKKVCCIGDSYTSGHMTDPNGATYETQEDYAWCRYMEQSTGNAWVNCGVSGANVLTWQNAPRGLEKMVNSGKSQAYIVALMLNDAGSSTRTVELGSTSDINTNAQTYYGGLSQIVNHIKEQNPQGKIFLCTCPSNASVYRDYNQAVKDVVNYYKNECSIFCLDMHKYRNLYSTDAMTKSMVAGHYTAAGYEMCAENMMYILSETINENATEFNDVAFIPYD